MVDGRLRLQPRIATGAHRRLDGRMAHLLLDVVHGLALRKPQTGKRVPDIMESEPRYVGQWMVRSPSGCQRWPRVG